MKRLLAIAGIVALVFLLLGAGLASGIVLDRQVLVQYLPPDNVPSDAISSFQLIVEAWNTIRQSYVEHTAVQAQTLTYGAIGGMVDATGETALVIKDRRE